MDFTCGVLIRKWIVFNFKSVVFFGEKSLFKPQDGAFNLWASPEKSQQVMNFWPLKCFKMLRTIFVLWMAIGCVQGKLIMVDYWIFSNLGATELSVSFYNEMFTLASSPARSHSRDSAACSKEKIIRFRLRAICSGNFDVLNQNLQENRLLKLLRHVPFRQWIFGYFWR